VIWSAFETRAGRRRCIFVCACVYEFATFGRPGDVAATESCSAVYLCVWEKGSGCACGRKEVDVCVGES